VLHDTLRFIYLNKGKLIRTSDSEKPIVDNFIEVKEPGEIKLSIINQLISTPVLKTPKTTILKEKIKLAPKQETVDFTSPDFVPCLGQFIFFVINFLHKMYSLSLLSVINFLAIIHQRKSTRS